MKLLSLWWIVYVNTCYLWGFYTIPSLLLKIWVLTLVSCTCSHLYCDKYFSLHKFCYYLAFPSSTFPLIQITFPFLEFQVAFWHSNTSSPYIHCIMITPPNSSPGLSIWLPMGINYPYLTNIIDTNTYNSPMVSIFIPAQYNLDFS